MPTKMQHPDSSTTIEVEPERVTLYEASGWVVVKDKPQAKADAKK